MLLFDQDVVQSKSYFRGTHRSVSPAETLSRYVPLLPFFGITRLADITGLDSIGLPVYTAIRPNSRSLATSQGKGCDHDSAKVSAMMESIESWHAERANRACRYDSYNSLRRTSNVVDPFECARGRGMAPEKDVPLYWTMGWDLMAQNWCYVPSELVTLNLTYNSGFRPTFSMNSNGLSSGNHPLEAIAHGLCEVIERDADTLWTRSAEEEKIATQIDLATIDDAASLSTLALLARANVAVEAWDITSDLGIPVFKVNIYPDAESARWRPVPAAGGYGCHLSPGVALMRALSEAIQSRVTAIAGSRDDVLHEKYEKLIGDAMNQHAVVPAPRRTPTRSYQTRARRDTPTFEGDIETLLQALRQAGITHAVAVDLSFEPIKIPVVKVIVPGLEDFQESPGYQPGKRALARTRTRG
jgi:YcaO-like protein with predicted kinase domain